MSADRVRAVGADAARAHDLLDDPVIVARGEDGQISARFNRCRHPSPGPPRRHRRIQVARDA